MCFSTVWGAQFVDILAYSFMSSCVSILSYFLVRLQIVWQVLCIIKVVFLGSIHSAKLSLETCITPNAHCAMDSCRELQIT